MRGAMRISSAAALGVALGVAAVSTTQVSAKPNILILYVDDLGYGDIGVYGNATIKTPHIDSLAGMAGSRIARVMPSPATPGGISLSETTIASMLSANGYATGMVGKWHLGMGTNCSLCPRSHGFDSYWGMPVTNVQACAQRAEWVTHKNRLDFILNQYPADVISRTAVALLVFSFLLTLAGRMPRGWCLAHVLLTAAVLYLIYWVPATVMLLNHKACVLYRDNDPIEQPVQLKYLTHRGTLRAERFMYSAVAAKKPFFLYMAYHKVHTALFTTDEFEGVSMHGEYGDNVEEMDWSVGRLLTRLEDLGVADDTFVYFSSDNGPWKEQSSEGGACGFAPADPEHPLKGGKAQTWECGIRVPGIIRWRAGYGSQARVLHTATTNMDILPTVAAIAGVAVPPHVSDLQYAPAGPGVIDGRDLNPVLRSSEGSRRELHDFIFHYCDMTVAAVRHGIYKAHFATTIWEDEDRQSCPTGIICKCAAVEHDPPIVYDIEADPAELNPIELSNDAEAAAAVARMAVAKLQQEGSVIPIQSQTELPPSVPNFPCCGFPHPGWARLAAILFDQCGC